MAILWAEDWEENITKNNSKQTTSNIIWNLHHDHQTLPVMGDTTNHLSTEPKEQKMVTIILGLQRFFHEKNSTSIPKQVDEKCDIGADAVMNQNSAFLLDQ